MEFKGKVALISGGSKGIGFSCAKRLASEGSDIFLLSSNQSNLDKASQHLKDKFRVKVGYESTDLSSLNGCQSAVSGLLKSFGRCDVFIHSAGATQGGIFPNQPDEDMIDGFALKFHAAVRLTRLLWEDLKKSHGTVINIVGGYARTPSSDHMVGGSVNAALANFSKSLAGQGLKDDVNVNWIHPGMIQTERLEKLFRDRAKQQNKSIDQIKDQSISSEGLRRLGEPDDVASLVAFLCRKEARHIQGAGITIDGGGTKGFF